MSTRKGKHITEEQCGTSFSKSLDSSLASGPNAEIGVWRDRQIEAKAYPYLIVDARYDKVRTDRRVVSQGVLVVSGVREDGMRGSSPWRWTKPRARRPTGNSSGP